MLEIVDKNAFETMTKPNNLVLICRFQDSNVHQILLKRLKHYGADEKTLAWLRSYLFQRKQYIENSNDIKYLLEIDCGVPQRSVLGPLLFLIYVNDFCLASKFKNVMFADDTNLLLSDENISELFQQMNKELKSVSTWFKANKFSINIDKPNGLFLIQLLKSVSYLQNFQNYSLMV